MNNSKPLILIVAPPGDLQIGLQALLTTHLEVDVLVTGEDSSAMKVIERHNPAMVIVDNDLPKMAAPMIIHNIKTTWPDIRCIVLVSDEEGRQKFWGIGVELIVIKGLPGGKLVTEIEQILFMEEKDHPMSKEIDGE